MKDLPLLVQSLTLLVLFIGCVIAFFEYLSRIGGSNGESDRRHHSSEVADMGTKGTVADVRTHSPVRNTADLSETTDY